MTEVLITSSVLILVLTALRFLLRGRVSPRLQYGLWLLVALRLLIPVGLLPTSPVSVLNAVPPAGSEMGPSEAPPVSSAALPVQAPAQKPVQAPDQAPIQAPDQAPVLPPVQVVSPAAPAPREPAPASPIRPLLPALWLGGTGLLSLWFLLSSLIFRQRLRRSARRLEVAHYPLPVYVTEAVPSPCLFGLLRPAVYLTPDCLKDSTHLWHIFTHERTHFRQGDHLWSALRCVLLCLYWFDPLVWLAAALSRRDCELACDEGSLKSLGDRERMSYGRTLLSMVVPTVSPRDLLCPATTMTSGKRSLKERVTLIAKQPKMLAATLAVVLLITVSAVVCTFTGAGQQSPEARLFRGPEGLGKATAQPLDQREVVPLPTPPVTGQESLDERLLRVPEGLPVIMEHETGGGFSYYFEEAYGTVYGGFICGVLKFSFAEFSEYNLGHILDGSQYMGSYEGWYYFLYYPTDGQFSNENGNRYMDAFDAIDNRVNDIFATQQGMTPPEEDFIYQAIKNNHLFSGNHIDVSYTPSNSYRWTLLLSQPARQGDGGIWCVDRCWTDSNLTYHFDLENYYVIPQTDLTMEKYYENL